MKKLLLLTLTVFSIISCSQSPENKANALIQKDVKNTLSHPESYEALETVVDSAFAPFDDPAFYKKTLMIVKKTVGETNDSIVLELRKDCQELSDMMGTEYRFIGYKIKHSYSAQDNEGEPFVGERVYIMDKDMSGILAKYDTDSLDYVMVQTMYSLWRDEDFETQDSN